MKPIFKYSGGKTRELKRIDKIIDGLSFERIIEPFAGGCAFAFSQEKPSIISDIRHNNIDVYKTVKDKSQFDIILQKVEETKQITDKKELEKLFYYWRDDKYQNCDTLWEKAFRWLIIRQLCFSGMDRVNKQGKFNVPYGWYPKFSCSLNEDHHELLQDWDVDVCSFETSIAKATQNDFIFLDPPYLDRNSDYGDTSHNISLHEKLFEMLSKTEAKWLLIHSEHDFYKNTYQDYHIISDDFKYGSQWKGREQKDRKVKHLYITNFITEDKKNLDIFERFGII